MQTNGTLKPMNIPPLQTDWRTLYIVIRGTQPVLFHDRLAMQRLEAWKREHPRDKVPSPEVEAEMGCLRDPETQAILLRADSLLESAKEGAKEVMIKRPGSGRTKNAVGVVSAGIALMAEAFPLLRPTSEPPATQDPYEWLRFIEQCELITRYELDTRRVVVQRQGVMRTRPRIDPPWYCLAQYRYDACMGGQGWTVADAFLQALRYAGELVGVGDYRVGKGGIFGRYEVMSAWSE